jgi:uncharacterized protein (TIRG00374 family)
VCAASVLAFAFSRVDFAAVKKALVGAEPSYIAAAMFAYWLNLLLRAWRWRAILGHVQRLPFETVLNALIVGYGVNNVTPGRLGELFRAEFFKQRYGLSRVWGLASIVLERLLDGLIVVCCLTVGLIFASGATEHGRVLIGISFMAAAIFGTVLSLVLILSGAKASATLRRWRQIGAQLEMVRRGLEIIRSSRFLLPASASILVYVADTLSLWLIVRSVGVTLNLADALVLVGAASLSTLVPSGPGFLGPMQLAYVLTMELSGNQPAVGIAAATLVQIFLLLPVAICAGFLLAFGARPTLESVTKPTSGPG